MQRSRLMQCFVLINWIIHVANNYCLVLKLSHYISQIRAALQTEPTWGPALEENRTGKYAIGNAAIDNMGFVNDSGHVNEKHQLEKDMMATAHL